MESFSRSSTFKGAVVRESWRVMEREAQARRSCTQCPCGLRQKPSANPMGSGVIDCFGRENKEGAGTKPRASWQLSLFGGLATGGTRLLRRRLLRRGGLARGLLLRWFLLRCCHSSSLLRAGWLLIHSSYIHSSLHTYRI